jgi:hypothetical protein
LIFERHNIFSQNLGQGSTQQTAQQVKHNYENMELTRSFSSSTELHNIHMGILKIEFLFIFNYIFITLGQNHM